MIEIVSEMAQHLQEVLPGLAVRCDDAFRLPEVLLAQLHRRVGRVICGIPLVMLPLDQPRRFVDAVEQVAPGVGFPLYSYCINSPLSARA